MASRNRLSKADDDDGGGGGVDARLHGRDRHDDGWIDDGNQRTIGYHFYEEEGGGRISPGHRLTTVHSQNGHSLKSVGIASSPADGFSAEPVFSLSNGTHLTA